MAVISERLRYDDETYIHRVHEVKRTRVASWFECKPINHNLLAVTRTIVTREQNLESVHDKMGVITNVEQLKDEQVTRVSFRPVNSALKFCEDETTLNLIEYGADRTVLSDGAVWETSIAWIGTCQDNAKPLPIEKRLKAYSIARDVFNEYCGQPNETVTGLCFCLDRALGKMRMNLVINERERQYFTPYIRFYLWPELIRIMPAGVSFEDYWWSTDDYCVRATVLDEIVSMCESGELVEPIAPMAVKPPKI